MKKLFITSAIAGFAVVVSAQAQRNLIQNPNGSSGLDNWTVVNNGGDGWATVGTGTNAYFVTSYELDSKSQTINLLNSGYQPADLSCSVTFKFSDTISANLSSLNICRGGKWP